MAVKVLFICMGNICRSPLAEGIFKHKVTQLGLGDQFHIDSAGTGGWHEDEPADGRSKAVAEKHGISLTGKARQIRPGDTTKFDYLIVMDDVNYETVQRLHQSKRAESKLVRMRDYDSQPDDGQVPDPYSLPDQAFDQVYEILDRSTDGFIATLREEHGL